MLTLRQLRFLVALDESLSFSRASELCHVTQSTLSTGLKEIETRLGVRLAERTTQSVVMTRIGADIAERARAVLAAVEDIEAAARAEAEAGAAVLRLGAIPTAGPFLMPLALPAMREAFPGMRVYLREELTDSLLRGLAEARLDLILVALPQDIPRQIEVEPLFDDGYELATPLDHPLAGKDVIEADDLGEKRLLLLDPGHCLQRHALSSFPEAALGEDPSFSATSLPTLMSMVEAGLGVTLLPDLAVAAGAAKGHALALRPLPGAKPRTVALAWRASSATAPLYRRIAAVLRTVHARLREEKAAH
jgi:LysR family hydrogen peroxide-inducible transcriptional activator